MEINIEEIQAWIAEPGAHRRSADIKIDQGGVYGWIYDGGCYESASFRNLDHLPTTKELLDMAQDREIDKLEKLKASRDARRVSKSPADPGAEELTEFAGYHADKKILGGGE